MGPEKLPHLGELVVRHPVRAQYGLAVASLPGRGKRPEPQTERRQRATQRQLRHRYGLLPRRA